MDVFIVDGEIREEIKAIIETVWSQFDEITQIKWLASIEIPITAEVAISKITNIVEWATLEYDGVVVPQRVLELRDPEKEPVPASIDPWARGAGTMCFIFLISLGLSHINFYSTYQESFTSRRYLQDREPRSE